MYLSAIARLAIFKANYENNAPIQEKEGRKSEARLSRANAKAYGKAIEVLKGS